MAMPACVPTIFTLALVYATEIRMVSKRPTTKQANEQTNGILPVSARPAPTPTMLDSAIPRLKARAGNRLAKLTVMVDFDRSASSVTMRSSRAPKSSRASPNAARVALAGMLPLFLLLVERAQLVDDGPGRGVGGQVVVPGGFADAEDLADGRDSLGGLRRFAMPLGIVLHERHALALDGVGDDERGPAERGLGLVEGLVDLGQVVAVDLDDGPAEALPLGDERLEVEDLRDEIVELDLVVVHDHGEVVERAVGLPKLGRRHRGLPHLALLELAVAENAVDTRRRSGHPQAQRHAAGDRQPLAERARRRLDPRQGNPVGVALERAAELAQRDELLLGEVAASGHDGVERGDGVALGEHDAVAIGPVGSPGIVSQAAEGDRHQQIDHRQRAAGMAGAGVGQHANDLHAARAGDRVELHLRHQGRSPSGVAMASTWTPETAISGA